MITPIDVVDSAVKIGLGAVISGLATYWVAKANHLKAIEKERAERKTVLLETIAEQVASFDQFALAYWEKVVNWLAFSSRTEPMSAELRAEIARLSHEVSEGYKDLKSAEAKLLLLGDVECQKLLRNYGEFAKVYRQESIEARSLEVEDLKKYKEELRTRREEFFDSLSEIYRTV